MAAADDPARKVAAQPLPDSQPLEFYDKTTQATADDSLQPRPTAPAHDEGSEPPAAPPPDHPAASEPVPDKVYLQIAAIKDRKEAEQALAKVQSKGFRALILAPKPGDRDSLYRVHVGPYDTNPEAAVAKNELLAQGYTGVFQK
jgi:cell division septation protein DedD